MILLGGIVSLFGLSAQLLGVELVEGYTGWIELIGGGIFVLALFAWMPFQRHEETDRARKKECAELLAKLTALQTRRDLLDSLSNLRFDLEEMIKEIKKCPPGAYDAENWAEKIRSKCGDLMEFVEIHCGRTETVFLTSNSDLGEPNYSGSNEQIAKQWAIHNLTYYSAKLKQIIERHQHTYLSDVVAEAKRARDRLSELAISPEAAAAALAASKQSEPIMDFLDESGGQKS